MSSNNNQTLLAAKYPFAQSAEEFWSGRPDDVSPWSWLFHPLNRWRFELRYAKLINKIRHYATQINNKFTFFFQRNIARWLGISEQWLREMLRRLKLIGVIEDRKVKKNRQYQVIESIFDSENCSNSGETCGENEIFRAVTDQSSESYSEPTGFHSSHHVHELRSISIISADDQQIISSFEENTGTKFHAYRDAAALQELRKLPVMAVIAGILIVQLRVPGTKVNSLAYVVGAAREMRDAMSGNNGLKINENNLHSMVEQYWQKCSNWTGNRSTTKRDDEIRAMLEVGSKSTAPDNNLALKPLGSYDPNCHKCSGFGVRYSNGWYSESVECECWERMGGRL